VSYLAEPCQGSNGALRSWQRLRSRWVASRAPAEQAEPEPTIDIPDHEEWLVDQDELIAAIQSAGLDSRVEYWSQFDGLERLPALIYALILRALTPPWRRRSGNMLLVTGSKPDLR
jgi:hypothetical protein